MAKKKAGSLSSGMINRHGRRDGVGFVLGDDEGKAGPVRRPMEGSDLGEDSFAAQKGEAKDSGLGEQEQRDTPRSSGAGGPAPAQAVPCRDAGHADNDEQTRKERDKPSSSPDAMLVVRRRKGLKESADVVALYPERGPDRGVRAPEKPSRPYRPAASDSDSLVAALRSADIAEAEEIFARMTGLSHVTVLRLLYGPDGRDLALACCALGMEQLQFVSVFILSRKLGLGEEALDSRDLARVVAYFDACDETEAVARLAAWRAAEQQDSGDPLHPA